MTIPSTFFCPITKRIMHDPVMDKEGNSYEKLAIEEWLRTNHHTSPITRNPLIESDLTPNRALKDAIETFIREGNYGDDWTTITSEAANLQDLQETNGTGTGERAVASTLLSSVRSEDEPVEINCKLMHDLESGDFLVSVIPPTGRTRLPVDLVCVIDISGSMDSYADIKKRDEENNEIVERTGLTMLDVVKHALRTIIASLDENDRLGLVTFSSAARRELPMTHMTAAGKSLVTGIVNNLRVEGSTNLWDGLHQGLKVIQEARDDTHASSMRTGSLFLLTDGMPNVEPPRGSPGMLAQYIDTHGLVCSVNTFGFGYSLDSVMLDKLAVIGNGTYSFIPDAGMVGTIFINALANLLVTIANNSKITIEPLDDSCHIESPYVDAETTSWGISYLIGNIQYDQKKDFLFRVAYVATTTDQIKLRVVLHYDPWNSLTTISKTFEEIHAIDSSQSDDMRLEISCAKNRLSAVNVLRQGLARVSEADAHLRRVVAEIVASPSSNHPAMKDLIEDLSKEATYAFRNGWFLTWGRHYIPSLSRAHLVQQCNNFKDPGIQHYGGALFKQIRDHIDNVFNNLPPATPSRPVYDIATNRHVYRQPINMSYYNVSSDPCFHGSCMVRMEGKKLYKRVDEICKGDVLENGAKVVCVLKTNIDTRRPVKMIHLKKKNDDHDLYITPWHPIYDFYTMSWKFPIDLAGMAFSEMEISNHMEMFTDAIYSFVLDSHHIIDIADIPCITLGHGFTDTIRAHPFFGTNKVIDEMKKFPGFDRGMVEISETKRDGETGLVNGFKFSTSYMYYTPKPSASVVKSSKENKDVQNDQVVQDDNHNGMKETKVMFEEKVEAIVRNEAIVGNEAMMEKNGFCIVQ